MAGNKKPEIPKIGVDYLFRISVDDGVHGIGIVNGGLVSRVFSPLTDEQIRVYEATGKAYYPNGARIVPETFVCDDANVFDADTALPVKTDYGDRTLADVVLEISQRSRALQALRQEKTEKSPGKSLLEGIYQLVLPIAAVTTSPIVASNLNRAFPTQYNALGLVEGIAQFVLGTAAIAYFAIKDRPTIRRIAKEEDGINKLGRNAVSSLLEHYITEGKIPTTYCIPK